MLYNDFESDEVGQYKQNEKKIILQKSNHGCGCGGCLFELVSFCLIITGICSFFKETGKDHLHDYCKWDRYFGNHQEDQIKKEFKKRDFYIYEKEVTDLIFKSDYEKIKDSISKDAKVETIKGPTLVSKEVKGKKVPIGYDYVSDGKAYKTINEDQVRVTTIIRVLSTKKELKDFKNIGKYNLADSDEVFIFTKGYNADKKASDVKFVSLNNFDQYVKEGYDFIGIADLKSYEMCLFKTQCSTILDNGENHNYADSTIVNTDNLSYTKK